MLKRWIFIPILAIFLVGCQRQQPVAVSTPAASPSPTASCCAEALEAGAYSDLSIYHLESNWTDQNSHTLELGSLRGNVVLVAMIYSTCKAACPMILEDMRKIEAEVNKDHPGKLRYLLISFDPEVDTPARLKEFSDEVKLGENWAILNGNEDDILELAALLGVKYKKTSETDFAHSNIITVLNPQGEIVYQQEGLNIEPEATVEAIKDLLKTGD
jgi:protein SCO1